MIEQILGLTEQLRWQPVIANSESLAQTNKFIVAGMGGSHLAADLLRTYQPELDLLIHRDYGLPRVPAYFLQESLIVVCSHSGETAEALDVLRQSLAAGLKVAVLTAGGQLLRLAQEQGLPNILYPGEALAPRQALGFTLVGLAALFRLAELGSELAAVAGELNPASLRDPAALIADRLVGRLPLIYSATQQWSLGYIWKIKLNETAKLPAFANVFPELNHNELEGFERSEALRSYALILLRDPDSDSRIKEREAITADIYRLRGAEVIEVPLTGRGWVKLLSSVLLADWVSWHLADRAGLDPVSVPLITEFKKRLT